MENEIIEMEPSGRVLPLFCGDYLDNVVYENPDIVLYNNSSYVAKNTTIGNPPPTDALSDDNWQMVAKGIIDADVSTSIVKFNENESESMENIESGETLCIGFGKIRKALTLLFGHYAKKATASILGHIKLSNSAAITKSGEYALDAIEKNAVIDGTLAHQIAQLNSNMEYKAGDKILRSYNLWICGTLTGGGKEIWVTIPLDKPITGTPVVVMTAYIFTVRQNGTYLTNITSLYDFEDSGIEISYRGYTKGVGLTFVFIERTNGFGGLNNDTVAISMLYDIAFT